MSAIPLVLPLSLSGVEVGAWDIAASPITSITRVVVMKSGETLQATDKQRRDSIWRKYAYHILGGAAVLVLIVGTVAYHYIEGWSWIDSFYFSAIAGSTVGFGDLVPSTDASKLFTILYVFSAIGILGTFLDQRLRHHGVVKKRTDALMNEVANRKPE